MSSLVCIDANVVVRSLVPHPQTTLAMSLFESWNRSSVSLIAPALLPFEVTATLRRMVYLKRMSAETGEEAFFEFQNLPIRISHRSGIFQVAWKLAKDFNRPRAYDMAYLAVAQMHGCDFWTTDKHLYNAVHDRLAWVKLLSDTE